MQNIFSSPVDLMRKVEKDKVSLEKSMAVSDEVAIRESLFNFVVGAYHLVDWIKIYYPSLEQEVYNLLSKNKYLSACRDLCNASKHVKLELNKGSYKIHPPVLGDVEYSPTGAISPSGISEFKVKVEFNDGYRIPVENLMEQVITAWKKFFEEKGIE